MEDYLKKQALRFARVFALAFVPTLLAPGGLSLHALLAAATAAGETAIRQVWKA